MPSRESTSPSPPPAQPIISAPGPRFLALQKIFNQALTATTKANSYANFSQCFPTTAQHCPSSLESVWKKFNARLEAGCVKEFEAIVSERKVVEGLNGWDAAVEEARRMIARGVEGQEAPRAAHTLSTDELHAAYLTPYLENATSLLNGRLKETQDENGELMERITSQRAEMESLIRGLESVVGDLEGSVGVMGNGNGDASGGVNKLKDEVWEIENEFRASSER